MEFDLDKQQREDLLRHLQNKMEDYYSETGKLDVTPGLDPGQIRAFVDKADFNKANNLEESLDFVIEGMQRYTVQCSHPKYFGLFNPRANFSGIMADYITANMNPQLAAWSHSPFANEVESRLIQDFGLKFGYKTGSIDGVFAAGGAEANLTAILCALDYTFPDYAANGLMGMSKRPIIYCSEQAHHSINKAAKIVGLGYMSVRGIAVNKELKIDVGILQKQIEKDLADGGKPFMLIGTAGTTGSGEIDDLPLLKQIAIRHNLWFHVDAAWGGGAILSKKLKPLLKGIEESDSITFDAHKWMSVPMGTSLLITSHKEILARTFRVTTEYMPKEASAMDVTDPYTHSIQWSRRFIGLRVYLSLLFYGWEGYEEVIDHQTRMGNLLREKLLRNKWSILNKSPLPLVCFSDESYKDDHNFTLTILQNILDSGKSWISVYPINKIPAFRVCITNYNTSEKDLDELVDELNAERENYIPFRSDEISCAAD